jgi:lipoprotein NlpD
MRQRQRNGLRVGAWAIAVIILVGCSAADPRSLPVLNAARPANEAPETYKVRRGDSLYLIAMEFDLDWRNLADWNDIGRNGVIYPGQILRLHGSSQAQPQTETLDLAPSIASSVPDTYVVQRGDFLSKIAERFGLAWQDLARWNSLKKPYTLKVGQTLRLRGDVTGSTTQTARATKPATTSRPSQSTPARTVAGKGSWPWPSGTRQVQKSGKGIDLFGKEGDPINAVAPGQVVYSGSNLVRYGNLVIVKHDEHVLTAYAHNAKILVKEGDAVKVGQKIAEMGKTGTDRVRLHFEVRVDGKAVDPLRYLGKR